VIGVTHHSLAAASFRTGTDTPTPKSIIVTDWPLAPTDLASAACREADRNLTPAEWKQYVGTFDAYEKTCEDLP
jgi:hypothetical protein